MKPQTLKYRITAPRATILENCGRRKHITLHHRLQRLFSPHQENGKVLVKLRRPVKRHFWTFKHDLYLPCRRLTSEALRRQNHQLGEPVFFQSHRPRNSPTRRGRHFSGRCREFRLCIEYSPRDCALQPSPCFFGRLLPCYLLLRSPSSGRASAGRDRVPVRRRRGTIPALPSRSRGRPWPFPCIAPSANIARLWPFSDVLHGAAAA